VKENFEEFFCWGNLSEKKLSFFLFFVFEKSSENSKEKSCRNHYQKSATADKIWIFQALVKTFYVKPRFFTSHNDLQVRSSQEQIE